MRGFRSIGDPLTDIPALLAWRGDGLTFVELMRWLPYLKGDRTLHIPGNSSLVLWIGVTEGCISAIGDMQVAGKIELKPTGPLTYVLDGHRSRLPVASKRRAYKQPHWFPVTFAMSAKARAALPASARTYATA